MLAMMLSGWIATGHGLIKNRMGWSGENFMNGFVENINLDIKRRCCSVGQSN